MDTFGNTQAKIIPLDLSENQFQIYNKISRNYSHSFLFESLSGPEVLAETSVMGFDPKIIFKGYSDRVEIIENKNTRIIKTGDPFIELKKLLGKSDDQKYRYLGGAVGVVNYDSIRLVENISEEDNLTQPIMEFGIYDDGLLYDNVDKKLFYFYHDVNRFNDFIVSDDSFDEFHSSEVTPNMDKEKFSNIVNKAKQYIHDGDIFQVVLSRKFAFETSGDNLTLYKTLRKLNPSPYMYHLKQDSKTIIGASPEMLVRITDDKVETFPIAGTRKITDNEEKNKALSEELIHDEKELAEHTMLVDLGRNDIGRVCEYGSVKVTEKMFIERYSQVMHIASNVEGTIRADKDALDVFCATFPAGTLSGAPKIRAMQIIDEIEPVRRTVFGGSVGYLGWNGNMDTAIAIRTAVMRRGEIHIQAGAGVVADSVPEKEWDETNKKALALIKAVEMACNGLRIR